MTTKMNIFRTATNVKTYMAGEVIFEAGEPSDVMYVVQEGAVDIVLNGKLMETVMPGGILGEMGVVDHSPRSATALVREDAKVVPVDEAQFNFLVQQAPFFAIQVMRVMAERLRNADAILA